MKIDSTKLLLITVILMIGYNSFFKKSEIIEPTPVTVTLPESYGSTGLQALEPKVVIVQVPAGNGSTQQIDVDAIWKEQYEKASQQIKDSLYNEAIRINTYSDTLVNNEEVIIQGNARTRGSLLDFKVDYKLKERAFDYTPKVDVRYPKLSAGLGMELGAPRVLGDDFAVKGNLSFMDKKGHEINLSYDTEQRVWLGYKKNFKLKK